MPLSPSRRTLAAVAVAAVLLLSSPAAVRALPFEGPGEPRGLAGWLLAFLSPLWEANGSGLDPSGNPNGDTGSGLDPNGRPTSNGDNGSGLDPDGRP